MEYRPITVERAFKEISAKVTAVAGQLGIDTKWSMPAKAMISFDFHVVMTAHVDRKRFMRATIRFIVNDVATETISCVVVRIRSTKYKRSAFIYITASVQNFIDAVVSFLILMLDDSPSQNDFASCFTLAYNKAHSLIKSAMDETRYSCIIGSTRKERPKTNIQFGYTVTMKGYGKLMQEKKKWLGTMYSSTVQVNYTVKNNCTISFRHRFSAPEIAMFGIHCETQPSPNFIAYAIYIGWSIFYRNVVVYAQHAP